MSLLEELRALDVSRIVSARASLSDAVGGGDLLSLAQHGNAAAVLGDLGRSLDGLKSAFPTPESLLRPLVDVLGQLAPQLDASHLPIGRYTDAVREGATFAGRVLSGFNDHPADWGRAFGSSLGDALQLVGGKASQIGQHLGGPADRFAELTNLLEHPPTDTLGLAQLALEVTLPFERRTLVSLRDGTKTLVGSLGRISLPAGRTSGLVAAFDLVATTAATRDVVRLQAALRELDRARRQTIASLEDDLRFVVEQIARLRVPQLLNPLGGVSATIRSGRDGVIEFMRDFGRDLGEIRFQIERLDADRIRQFLRDLPDLVENQARKGIEAQIDRLVARTKEALRDLFRRLPVREYRAEVSRFLHEVAERIEGANLDGPANAARGALADASAFLTSNALAGEVRAEMQRLNTAMHAVLDRIEAPLAAIAAEVDVLANTATGVLQRAADALLAFQTAIDAVQKSVGGLGLHERERQIVEALQNLQKKAEDLLSKVPLPDSLRPQVEQLAETLRRIDFDQLMQPVRDVAAQIRIPDEAREAVELGLEEARRAIENLIPQQLVDAISRDVEEALSSIRGFDPAGLVPDLSSYIEQAASAVERLDPRGIAETIRGPYQTVLDVVDRAHPLNLLRPVIDAYDSLVGAIPAPNPIATVRRLGDALDSAGRVAGRALVEPVTRLTPDAQPEVGDPTNPRPVEIPEDLGSIRPGDAIRVLGYLPGKLREALKALEASALGDVMREVDSCCAGLAGQLRTVPDAIAEVERRIDRELDQLLAPVAVAQAHAQLAMHANFSTGDLSTHLTAVASAGPVRLKIDLGQPLGLMHQALRDSAHSGAGQLREAFERAAEALESSPLASLAGNADALLAVLDPEPLAREMDLIMTAMLQKATPLVQQLGADLEACMVRLQAIVNNFNPMALAQRFLGVLDVLREELDVLNPRRLAVELAEIHSAIREAIEAYDPRLIAQDLAGLSRDVAQQIRSLDPRQLLGDLDFWQQAVDRAAALNPAKRLEGVGAALRPVGERLAAIDLDELVATVNQLSPLLVEEFEALLDSGPHPYRRLIEDS